MGIFSSRQIDMFDLIFFPQKIGFNQEDSLHEMLNFFSGEKKETFQNVFC